jgi:hypothetical protein
MSRKRKKNTKRRFDPARKAAGRAASTSVDEGVAAARADGRVVSLTDRENAHRRLMASGPLPPDDAA